MYLNDSQFLFLELLEAAAHTVLIECDDHKLCSRGMWYEVKVIPFGFWIVDSCLAMKKHCWAAFHLEEHSQD